MSAQQQTNGNNLVVQGRIVWTLGQSLFEGKNKTDFNTGVPIMGDDGQPIKEYGFGLAIPKLDVRTGQPSADFQKVWQLMHQEAFTLYPSGHIPAEFAMKYKDGDAVDHNGKPFADREGYKGHIVLACTTQIGIKFFRFEGGNNILVNDGIKCGDYVNVQLNIKAHPAKGRGKAGLYLNPSAVQLIQAGKEIINTPSGDQLFGTAAPAYAGQVEAPTAAPMPNIAPQGFAAPMPGMQPMHNYAAPMQQPAQQAPIPQAAPQPHYGVLPQTHQPAPQQAPMPGAQPAWSQPAQAAPAPQGYPPMPGMPR